MIKAKKMPSLKDEQALNVTHRLTPSNGIFGTWLTGGTLMTSLKCVFFLMFTAICHLVSVWSKNELQCSIIRLKATQKGGKVF